MTNRAAKPSMGLAGILAPAAGALWGATFFALAMAFAGNASANVPVVLFVITWLYGFAIALIFTWTIGLAWHVGACAYHWRSRYSYLTAGAVAGVMIAEILALTLLVQLPALARVTLFAWAISSSAVTAYVGWLIRRPDRDPTNPPTQSP